MKRILSAFLSIAVLGACVREAVSYEEKEITPEATALDPEAGTVRGVVVVEFDDAMVALIEQDLAAGTLQTKSTGLNEIFEELGVTSVTPVFPEEQCPPEYRARERAFGLRNFYYVEYGEAPLTKATAGLESLPGVVSAEPQYQIALNDTFNDPFLSQQWGFNNTSTPGADINCARVWQEFTTGSPDVIVEVTDTGIDLEHEDLAWNCIPAGNGGSYNFTNNSAKIDVGSHGTHVAGTIAAVNNNGKGVSGIAGGNFKTSTPGVRIMGCQTLEGKNGAGGSAANAIRWGANNGAVISQNSWGYRVDVDRDGKISADEMERARNMHISSSEKAAVDYFIQYAGCDGNGNQKADSPMKGGIVIFAAGNDNIPYGPPADYEKILAVGAMDRNGTKASYSNYGDWIDICAPGSNIMSTVPDNQYSNMSGTSMACPHVSGVAALIVSYSGGPGFTADLLWTKLVNGAKYNFVKTGSTPIGPLVDAYGAIIYGDSGDPLPVDEYTVKAQSNNIYVTWNVTPTTEGGASYAAMLFASKNKASLENMDPSKPGKDVVRASQLTSTNAVGDEVTGVITGLEFNAPYFVTLATYSYNNGFSSLAPIQAVTTGENHPPYVTIDLDPIPPHKNYEIWSIPITADDPDGHEVSVSYQPGGKADSLQPDVDRGGFMIFINGPLSDGGTFTGTITVQDMYGLQAQKTVTYTLTENSGPVVVKQIENQIFNSPGEERRYNLADIFRDDDGEPLSLDIQVSDKSAFHAIYDGANLIVTSLTYGSCHIDITAYDAKRASATMSFGALTREASVEVSTYPNPVLETLYIATGMQEEETPIQVYGASGAKVYDGTQTTSAFKPAQIDMAACSPGRYSVVFTYGGKEFKRTIVKK